MRIYNHALQNYLERVLNITVGQASANVVEFAEEQIKLAVRSPDMVYRNPGDRENCPVHVRNGCAVPVKEDAIGGTTFIPTVYKAGTFIRKFETHEPATVRG